ncbi:MAG: glycosyltransferase [Clostridia bacterium]|nr:glycosyltransferase [Clostridia bacterium]
MKKILVLYAKYGGGHLSAANAITTYIEEHYYGTCEVKCVDLMEYISPFLNKTTTDAYKQMAKHAPKLWKTVYYNSRKGFLSHISNKANELMAKKLLKLYKDFSPDIIISAHPFGTQMTSYLKETGKFSCTLATVLTDFAPHEQWLVGQEYCEYFFVSNEKMREDMIDNYGTPAEKIFATGVPLANTFSYPFYDDQTREKYHLKEDKKLILFFGGGEFGLGQKRTLQILESLTKHLDKYQIIAVSGKNKKMNKRFTEIAERVNNPDLHVIKYCTDVPDIMHISTLVVTKPGGLTSSESLASQLPIIITNPIPGQEEENAEFLESSGVAVWLKKTDDINAVISDILNNPEKLQEMKEKTKLIAKPNSTRDICKKVLGDF